MQAPYLWGINHNFNRAAGPWHEGVARKIFRSCSMEPDKQSGHSVYGKRHLTFLGDAKFVKHKRRCGRERTPKGRSAGIWLYSHRGSASSKAMGRWYIANFMIAVASHEAVAGFRNSRSLFLHQKAPWPWRVEKCLAAIDPFWVCCALFIHRKRRALHDLKQWHVPGSVHLQGHSAQYMYSRQETKSTSKSSKGKERIWTFTVVEIDSHSLKMAIKLITTAEFL